MRVAFYHVYLAFTLGTATALLIPQSASGRGSNFVFSIAWVAMHAISLLLLLGFRYHHATNLVIALAISLFIVSSALWSVAPTNSLIYGGMVAGNIATAYMVSQDCSLDEIIRMIARTILVIAVAGMVAGVAGFSQALYYDSAGRETILGTQPIRGFFNHKVPAALFATLGAVACIYSFKRWARLAAVLCLGTFVVLTGSSTGLLLFPFALVVVWILFRAPQIGIGVAVVVLALAFIGGILGEDFSAYWDQILVSLDRDPTLTGRTVLWEWGMQTWSQRPIFGWGFDGYFNGPNAGDISAVVKRFENYDVPHFHQSYIQTAVDLGIVGGLILLGLLLSTAIRSWRLLIPRELTVGVPILASVTVMAGAGATMFIFITYNHFATFILFVFFFSLRRLVTERSARSDAFRARLNGASR